MNNKSFILVLLSLIGFYNSVLAQKTNLTDTKGWSKVTEMPSNTNSYFYALYEHEHDAWGLQIKNAQNQSGKAMVLKDQSDPETTSAAVWSILNQTSNTHILVNQDARAVFFQTEWNRGWNWHTSDNGGGNGAWGETRFSLSDAQNAWQMQQVMYSYYIGPWDVNIVCDNEFAGNRTQTEAPYFDIYQIAKGRYVSNTLSAETLKQASSIAPIDLTYILNNPDANLRGMQGWTLQGSEWKVEANDAFPARNGTYYFQSWIASGALADCKMSQSFTDLPNGLYRLSVNAYYNNNGSGASVFANSVSKAVTTAQLYEVEVEVTDGHLEIGGRIVNGTSNYFCLDNFHLEYLGQSASSSYVDQTSLIVNPSFEQGLDGWINDGMSAQGNNAFTLKKGNTYCERWTGKGGQVTNASIQQTLTELQAGTYTVYIEGQNIQEDTPQTVQTGVYVFANDKQTPVSIAGTYSVTTTVLDGKLTLGYLLDGATGNYVTVDNFRLTWQEPTAAEYATMHQEMQVLVDEANSIRQNTVTAERTQLDNAKAAVVALISQNTTEGVSEAVVRLQEAIYDYKLSVASETESIDMTSYIFNPNFEKNGLEGWINNGMWTQSGGVFPYNGNLFVEAWTWSGNNIGDVSVSQRVSLPNGKYTLTAVSQNIQQGSNNAASKGAYIFAEDELTEVGKAKDYTVTFVVIEGQANIGFKTISSTGNWVCIDHFRLTYQGRSTEMLLSALQARIAKAESLTAQQMNAGIKQDLQQAIAAAKSLNSKEGMEQVAITLRQCTEAAEASNSAFALLKTAIDEVEPLYDASKQGSADFLSAIDKARNCYNNADSTDADAQAAEATLRKALFAYRVANGTGSAPQVTTFDYVARGATGALGRSTVSGSNIVEQGFCWSTHRNPTVMDSRSTDYYDINGPMYLMSPLAPATVYYVRAYAMTSTYAVGYGEERKVITLPMGNTSYWYNWGGSAEENERIDNALKECVYLYNNWSATTNFGISCSYGSGTPTADCSYGGSMRVGPSASYQRTGTILHESNHGVGVGQQARWWDGNLHSDGVWHGYRANSLVQFIDNNPNAVMYGDDMHMWPYGINGAHEDTGWIMTYIANVMITQALHEDGLIPPGHGGCKPAYVFEHEDEVKYYITNEHETFGNITGYLTETSDGTLTWSVPTDGATKDDAYAWYLTFDPARQLYTIRNAKSGKYFTYGDNIKTTTQSTPGNNQYFHLMNARQETTLGIQNKQLTSRSYWILAGADESNPLALAASAKGATTTPRFDLGNGAVAQRWFILTADEVEQLPTIEEIGSRGSIRYQYVAKEYVTSDAGRVSQDNFVYDEAANTVTITASGDNNVAFALDKGTADDKYFVSNLQKYYVIEATDLKTTPNSSSYIWWFNGYNRGSSETPNYTFTTSSGSKLIVWDIENNSMMSSNMDFSSRFVHIGSMGSDIINAQGLTNAETGSSTIMNINYLEKYGLAALYPCTWSELGYTEETLTTEIKQRLAQMISDGRQLMKTQTATALASAVTTAENSYNKLGATDYLTGYLTLYALETELFNYPTVSHLQYDYDLDGDEDAADVRVLGQLILSGDSNHSMSEVAKVIQYLMTKHTTK